MSKMKETMDAMQAQAPAKGAVPPERQDWWTRRLDAMPHADGQFRDEIFKRPIAAGTETLDFDRNAIDPDDLDNERVIAKIKPSEIDAAIRKADKDRREGKLSKEDHAKIKRRLDTMLTQARPDV